VIHLSYSQVEFAADARHRVQSCGPSPQVPCNKADAVRSACLKGKKMAIKMKVKKSITFHMSFLLKTYTSCKAKQKKTHRYFFMNMSGSL